jgi:hypothetical protein
VGNLTGKLKSSENSLNQHIKLKHEELWKKKKSNFLKQTDNIFSEENENANNKDNVYTFKIEDDSHDYPRIDFNKFNEFNDHF